MVRREVTYCVWGKIDTWIGSALNISAIPGG